MYKWDYQLSLLSAEIHYYVEVLLRGFLYIIGKKYVFALDLTYSFLDCRTP